MPFARIPHRINPAIRDLHPTTMSWRCTLAAVAVLAIPLSFAGCNACASKPSSPDQLREKTAEATAQLKENAKAVAQGVREGLSRPSPDKPLDLNRASKAQLMSLPGMDDATAERIIAGRPYSSEHEILEKHIVSREEYNRIADSITARR